VDETMLKATKAMTVMILCIVISPFIRVFVRLSALSPGRF